jgi:hypothetical protein
MLGPELLLAVIGLGSSGVIALWRISFALGRYEARTATVLESISKMLSDHESRIRDLEHPGRGG